MKHTTTSVVLLLLAAVGAATAEPTVGLFVHEAGSFEGYTLFAPLRSTTTYLIDNDGHLVHSWAGTRTPGLSVYLLESGHLLRTFTVNQAGFRAGGAGGGVEEVDWDGHVVWSYEHASESYLQHHDVEHLPGGNVLLIAWEVKSAAAAVAAGRDTSLLADGELWPDYVVEVEPLTGTVVWEWHVWDHLIQDRDPTKPGYGVVADHPERIDLNFVQGRSGADWCHTNSVDYNAELDQIVLSVHNFHEIWVIDHSTTAAEAAGSTGGRSGKGGDLLYRWGNPRAYSAGSAADRQLYGQHDAQWIDSSLPGAGNVLLFNNGLGRAADPYSSVDEITPPTPDADGNYALVPGSAYAPAAPTWVYTAPVPTDFYSSNISGAERLPNGNTLICSGANGKFFEVTPAGETVWLYVNPVVADVALTQGDAIPQGPAGFENNVFRAVRYAPDFTGFSGRTLVPGDLIELYPDDVFRDGFESGDLSGWSATVQ